MAVGSLCCPSIGCSYPMSLLGNSTHFLNWFPTPSKSLCHLENLCTHRRTEGTACLLLNQITPNEEQEAFLKQFDLVFIIFPLCFDNRSCNTMRFMVTHEHAAGGRKNVCCVCVHWHVGHSKYQVLDWILAELNLCKAVTHHFLIPAPTCHTRLVKICTQHQPARPALPHESTCLINETEQQSERSQRGAKATSGSPKRIPKFGYTVLTLKSTSIAFMHVDTGCWPLP